MDNVDLCMKNKSRYPWIAFTYAKQNYFLRIAVTTFHEKLIKLYIDSFSKLV